MHSSEASRPRSVPHAASSSLRDSLPLRLAAQMPTRTGWFPGKEKKQKKKKEKYVHASDSHVNVSAAQHCGICVFLTLGVQTVPKVTAASLQAGWLSRDHMLIRHWSAPSPATRVFPSAACFAEAFPPAGQPQSTHSTRRRRGSVFPSVVTES